MMKQEHYIFGLISVGAIVVLYWLYQESQAAAPAAAGASPDLSSPAPAPSYPNAQPIQLGNVYIGTTPAAQSYNVQPNGAQLATVAAVGTPQSECGCEDSDCEAAGVPVTVQTIPQSLVNSAAKNLATFTSKTNSGVQAARENLSTAAPAFSAGEGSGATGGGLFVAA